MIKKEMADLLYYKIAQISLSWPFYNILYTGTWHRFCVRIFFVTEDGDLTLKGILFSYIPEELWTSSSCG